MTNLVTRNERYGLLTISATVMTKQAMDSNSKNLYPFANRQCLNIPLFKKNSGHPWTLTALATAFVGLCFNAEDYFAVEEFRFLR